MKVRFMCGCQFDTEFVSAVEIEHDMELEAEEVPVEIDSPQLPTDAEGMLVCPTHGVRRYGWRSVGRLHHLDYMTPLEFERWYVFGESVNRPAIDVHAPTSPDIRMNQIPENVYATVLKSRSGQDPHEREAAVKDREITQQMKDDARRRLDLFDRTGWEVRDTQVHSLWDGD